MSAEYDEALRQVLIDMVTSAASLTTDQRKQIVIELQKIDIRNSDVKEHLRASFGAETFEGALRQATVRMQHAEPAIARERKMPKALATGGDVGILCGVDLSKERELLRSILVARRSEVFPTSYPVFVTPEYVESMYSVTSESLSTYLSAAVNILLRRVVLSSGSIKRDIQRAQGEGNTRKSSVIRPSRLHQAGNLKTLNLVHLMRGIELVELPPQIRERWEARLQAAEQAKAG